MNEQVEKMFVENPSSYLEWKVNEELAITLNGEQEAAKLLVEIILYWSPRLKYSLFHNYARCFDDKTILSISHAGTKCLSEMEGDLVAKLFGSYDVFTKCFFVQPWGRIPDSMTGEYGFCFSFGDLKIFAEGGREDLEQFRAAQQQEAERRKYESKENRRKEIEAEKAEWARTLESLTPELRAQLERRKTHDEVKVVDPNVAVVVGSRSENGDSGGVGKWSQVIVYCGNQSNGQEWQWRDRYNPNRDQPELFINSIGDVNVSAEEDGTHVHVELKNIHHGSRMAKFVFKNPNA